MDEEGDVVYFETSPAAEGLRSFNTIGDITNNILPSGLRTNFETKRVLDNGSTHWRQLMEKIRQFIASRWSEELKIHSIIKSIIDSSLLTEEDIQLLEFTLNSALLTTTPTIVPTKHTPITYLLITAVFILLMAILWNTNFLLILIVSLVTMATIFLLIKVDLFHRAQTKDYSDRIMGYVHEMETLLSLLTQSLRMIQERELVYHGFTRPTIRGVPVSRIERHNRSYQCVQLRERIYQTCNDGIKLIRGITHVLVEKYQLNMELDNRHSYLAYRNLTDLHSNEDENNNLSLESLKNTASLFAVLNSEMLQRLVLVLGHHLVVEPIKEYQCANKLNLSGATQLMKEVRLFVSQSCKQLVWSLEYQRLYLLDKAPPTHTSDPTSQVTNPISLIKADLHGADLHIHTTLIKLRELESNLPTDVQQIYLEEEIKAIQNNLIAAGQHLDHVIVQLHPSTTPIKSDNHIIEENDEHDEDIRQEDIMENIIEESEDDEVEDEKVYEAYVTNMEDISLLQDQNLLVENEEWKQASVTLLRELNSVLAVRKVEKERKRETRQKSKLPDECPMEHITVQSPDNHMTTNGTSHDPQTAIQNIPSIDNADKSHDHHVTPQDSQTAIHVSKQQSNPSSDSRMTTANKTPSSGSHMTTADKTHDYHVTEFSRQLIENEQDIEKRGPSIRDLANAIAAASKRTCEEVFEDSDDEENPPI